MGQNSKGTYRIFIIGVLMMIVISIIMTCLNGGYFHWLPTFVSILVLYRVARGADR